MSFRIQGSDVVPRINEFSLIGLAQNFEWTPNFNAEDIMELGNQAKVDTAMELETSGSFELMASGALPGVLARMKVERNSSSVVTGYKYASGGAFGKNAYTLTQADLSEMVFDLQLHYRTNQTEFNRTIWLPRQFLTGISGRADAAGMGSSTLNFAGDFVIGLPSPYHDHKIVRADKTSGVTGTCSPASQTGYLVSYIYINEVRFDNDTAKATYISGFVAATGVFTLTTTESYAIPADALIKVGLYKSSPSTIFQSVNSGEQGTTGRYIKGYMANLYIAPASAAAPTAAEKWLRVQSVDFNIDLKVTPLKQIAANTLGSAVYFRSATYPFDISLNATVLESDWDDWQAVLDSSVKTFPGNDIKADSYDLAAVSLKSSFNIVMIYYTRALTKLCEFRFTDMRVDGMGNRHVINGNAEVTWGFKGTAFTMIGYNA